MIQLAGPNMPTFLPTLSTYPRRNLLMSTLNKPQAPVKPQSQPTKPVQQPAKPTGQQQQPAKPVQPQQSKS
jgi:hypothetical protein